MDMQALLNAFLSGNKVADPSATASKPASPFAHGVTPSQMSPEYWVPKGINLGDMTAGSSQKGGAIPGGGAQ